MSKREEIIKNLSNSDDKTLLVKIIDYVEQVEKYFEPRFTQFLDPSQIAKAKRIVEQYKDIKYFVTCGVGNCERNIMVIYPYFMNEDEINLPIKAISVTANSKFENIGHRDVLGALMNLGIKREKIGDIILDNNKVYILVYDDISYYININLDKIKHAPVVVEYIDFERIPIKQESFKEITSNVASLRLDAIISAGFGESRSSISKEIERGNVKVNWEEITDLSFNIHEGDVVSLKGKGRMIIDSIIGTTRKGRINIVIKKII